MHSSYELLGLDLYPAKKYFAFQNGHWAPTSTLNFRSLFYTTVFVTDRSLRRVGYGNLDGVC